MDNGGFQYNYEPISHNNFFCICFAVIYAINLGKTLIRLKDMVSMLTLLTFINSCLNPIFYALYSRQVLL